MSNSIGATREQKKRYILQRLLEVFELCKEHGINLPDIYLEAEQIADPERG
jgi:hypothetical protein